MRAALLICLLICIVTMSGCIDSVNVSKKKNIQFLGQAQLALESQKRELLGTSWFAGRYAERFGFKRTEVAKLESIELTEFTCRMKQDGAWYSLKRKYDCHSYLNFKFKAGKKEKTFSTLVKFKDIRKKIVAKANTLRNRLSYGFVKENPFSKKTFAKYWKVLKKGKLAVGMPVDYLKICWGKPLRIFDKSIDATGMRETYVYDRYFVFLEDGIVRSIHKFDS